MTPITKLNQWLQAGLITPSQHANILSFEAKQRPVTNGWLYSFMVLGAAIIGLGILSLIAANWHNISDSVKLGVDFALLGLLAIGIYTQYPERQHSVWFEILLAGFLVLYLASIVLIAEIFDINGKWYHALLFWAFSTFLQILFARHLWTRLFWVTLFLQGMCWSLVTASHVASGQRLEALPAVFLLAPLLSAVLYYAATYLKALYSLRSSLFFWFQLSAICALAFADIARSGGELADYPLAWFLPAYMVAGLLALGILLHRDYRWLNRVLLLSALGLLLLYYYPDLVFNGQSRYTLFGSEAQEAVSFWQADDLRAPLLTLAILFLYALHAGNSGHQRTFHVVTFLIGLRFVILYFQAMGGLAATGVGLILSGSLIIGITWLWYRGRDRLHAWAKGLRV
ncbi:DUF2157 domain-containing protein [Thiothrix winogradskyi]|uniref:DUF2157 domain-containing protein n=1 Tax=Thiothrix winogradskyi TaxID=96472 RepID=A0ABY3T3P7_9GAMM|nr:DUF2157 domain-containing protein [Thiothrix winogradskyi]UJS26481.1 DUF2157 domain-containing protein [Thiothrix winogradskyi]